MSEAMTITVTYEREDHNSCDCAQEAVCTITIEGTGANVDWKFDPPLDDDTSDPCCIMTAMINAVQDALSGKSHA